MSCRDPNQQPAGPLPIPHQDHCPSPTSSTTWPAQLQSWSCHSGSWLRPADNSISSKVIKQNCVASVTQGQQQGQGKASDLIRGAPFFLSVCASISGQALGFKN